MRDHNPKDPLDPNRTTINSTVEERSGMGMMGILIALALAVGLGLFAWSAMDNNRVADKAAPGVTTGSSTQPSGPATPPPATPAPNAPATPAPNAPATTGGNAPTR